MTGLLTAWPVDLGILAAMFLLAGALTASPSLRRLRETAAHLARPDEDGDRE